MDEIERNWKKIQKAAWFLQEHHQMKVTKKSPPSQIYFGNSSITLKSPELIIRIANDRGWVDILVLKGDEDSIIKISRVQKHTSFRHLQLEDQVEVISEYLRGQQQDRQHWSIWKKLINMFWCR